MEGQTDTVPYHVLTMHTTRVCIVRQVIIEQKHSGLYL